MKNDFWPIVWRVVKDRYLILTVYILSSVGFMWMYVALFPYFKDKSAQMVGALSAYPESMIKAFNIDIASFTTIEGFLGVEHFSFVWPIFLIIMMTAIAGSAVAGEIEQGTIEVLLAQPISRIRLFLAKYLAGFFNLVVFAVISVFVIIPFAAIYNINYHLDNFAKFALLGFLFGLAIFSLAIFFSTIFSQKGKVYFLTGGLIIVMYVLNIVATIKESLSDLKYFSFFYYYNPADALVNGKIDHLAYWVFVGVAVVCAVAGALIFNRRDIAA